MKKFTQQISPNGNAMVEGKKIQTKISLIEGGIKAIGYQTLELCMVFFLISFSSLKQKAQADSVADKRAYYCFEVLILELKIFR